MLRGDKLKQKNVGEQDSVLLGTGTRGPVLLWVRAAQSSLMLDLNLIRDKNCWDTNRKKQIKAIFQNKSCYL